MTNPIAVKITADIVELQSKYAIASANTRAFAAEQMQLAKAINSGTADAGTIQRMQQVTQNLLESKTATAGYARSLADAGFSVSRFGQAAEMSSVHVASLARHGRMVATELAEGRFAAAATGMVRMATHIGSIGPLALGATAGVLAFAAGLGYLAVQAIKASNEMDHMQVVAALLGKTSDRGAIEALVKEVAQMGDVSEKEARRMVDAWRSLPDATDDAVRAMAPMTRAAKKAFDDDTKAWIEFSTKLLNAPSVAAGVKLLEEHFKKLSDEQLRFAESADASTNPNTRQAALMQLLREQLGLATPEMARLSAAQKLLASAVDATNRELDEGAVAESTETAMVEANTKALLNNAAVAKQRQDILAEREQTPEEKIRAGVNLHDKDPEAKRYAEASKQVVILAQALEAAKSIGSPRVEQLTKDLDVAIRQLKDLGMGTATERMNIDIAKMQATWNRSQVEMLQAEKARIAAALAEAGLEQKTREQLTLQMAQKDKEIRAAIDDQKIASVREANQEIMQDERSSAAQKASDVRANLEILVADDSISYEKRKQVQKEYNTAVLADVKASAAERRSIENTETQSELTIARMNFEAQKQILEEDFQAHRITAEQKYNLEVKLAQDLAKLEIAKLEIKKHANAQDAAEVAKLDAEEAQIAAKLNLDLATLGRQRVTDVRNEQRQEVGIWKQATNEILGAERGFLSNMLSGRMSFKQAAMKMTSEIAQKEIINDATAITQRLLLHKGLLAADEGLEKGGFLFHAAQNAAKTTSDATSEAARTAARVAGNEARVGADATAAAQSKAIQSATQSKSVMADAAKAYSGVYASVASIPYVGWILAPVAAGAAFAAVAAYEGLTSLDVGAWNVPQDMTARIHQGESVVPKDFASGLRAAFTNPTGGGPSYGDTNVNAHFHQVMPNSKQIMTHITRAIRNAHPATRGK